MKIYIKDASEFRKVKAQLDGRVFWREAGKNKIEIMPLDRQIEEVVKNLKD